MSPWLWLAAGVGGGVFAIARFVVDGAVSGRVAAGLPWGTFAVNVSGSFALGLLAGMGAGGGLYLVGGTACVGSYTTFSTWMLEAHRLADDDSRRPLAAYLLGSLAVGLLAVVVGRWVGRAL